MGAAGRDPQSVLYTQLQTEQGGSEWCGSNELALDGESENFLACRQEYADVVVPRDAAYHQKGDQVEI